MISPARKFKIYIPKENSISKNQPEDQISKTLVHLTRIKSSIKGMWMETEINTHNDKSSLLRFK